MRVIAGEKGGRRLLAPSGRGTRPTSDRVREAAFSMLDSQGVLDGARVWDLFAGSGAMGIEALSRGAAHATFVEQAQSAAAAARANLAALGYGPGRARVVCAEVLSWVGSQTGAYSLLHAAGRPSWRPPGQASLTTETERGMIVDVVTADPPYAWQGWGALFGALAPLGPLVVAETGDVLAVPDGWTALRSRRYGGTVVTLARPNEGHNEPNRQRSVRG